MQPPPPRRRSGAPRRIGTPLLVMLAALASALAAAQPAGAPGPGAPGLDPSGLIAFVDPDGAVGLLDPGTGAVRRREGGGLERAQFPAWSSDGNRVAVIVADLAGGRVDVIDAAGGGAPTTVYRVAGQAPIYLAWAPGTARWPSSPTPPAARWRSTWSTSRPPARRGRRRCGPSRAARRSTGPGAAPVARCSCTRTSWGARPWRAAPASTRSTCARRCRIPARSSRPRCPPRSASWRTRRSTPTGGGRSWPSRTPPVPIPRCDPPLLPTRAWRRSPGGPAMSSSRSSARRCRARTRSDPSICWTPRADGSPGSPTTRSSPRGGRPTAAGSPRCRPSAGAATGP
jgi:hypothetical protein